MRASTLDLSPPPPAPSLPQLSTPSPSRLWACTLWELRPAANPSLVHQRLVARAACAWRWRAGSCRSCGQSWPTRSASGTCTSLRTASPARCVLTAPHARPQPSPRRTLLAGRPSKRWADLRVGRVHARARCGAVRRRGRSACSWTRRWACGSCCWAASSPGRCWTAGWPSSRRTTTAPSPRTRGTSSTTSSR